MPTPPMKALTSWSFSRYGDYKLCPAKFKYKHLMGMKEPGSPAMDRGSDIHTLAENYALGKAKTLPAELGNFKEEFKALKAQKVKGIEESWTWTKAWAGETRWDDWKGAWVRIKIDAHYRNLDHNALVVIDHKTGKYRDDNIEEYLEQLELYALAGLKKFPDVEIVSPRLWYLDMGIIYPDGSKEQPELEFTRKDEPKLVKIWDQRIAPMFRDATFKPKPNNKCKWCHYRKENGGPCQY